MYYKNIFSDVFSGKAMASSPIKSIIGSEHVQEKSSPAILHFNGSFTYEYIYKSEEFRLKNIGDNASWLRLKSWLKFILPGQIKKGSKHILRPAYRIFFGNRKINKNERNS
jgi:hypothetical protein